MIINNNISARKSYNALRSVNTSLQKSIRSLSTGLRINSSSDDAAGFAVSEKMRSQISGLDTAIRNTQDASSLLQTAEGGLSSVNSILQRMRELSVQAASDTLTSQDRQYLQLEIDELKADIDRIAGTTEFNKKKILDGSTGASWSSNDLTVKAKINAPIEGSGGSFRLEVRTEPGTPQVQTSNMMAIQHVEKQTVIEEGTRLAGYKGENFRDIDISIDTVTASGEGWNLSGGIFHITESGTYSIIGKRDEEGNVVPINARILVEPGVEAEIYMKDVNITATSIDGGIPGGCAFYMAGAKVDLYIDGENYLTSGPHRSGLEASRGSTLTISSVGGDYSTRGTLNVTGGDHGAGIGGACGNSGGITTGGNITIKGGTINAKGGQFASGIGGGWAAPFENVTIEGGKVTATGGQGAAGIGSGAYDGTATRNNTGTINILGGEVTATGGPAIGNYAGGAGIGGGGGSSSGSITINNDAVITASSIGGGLNVNQGTNSITYTDIQPEPARTADFKDEQVTTTESLTTIASALNITRPETFTITQGNGNSTEVTLYPTDTVYEMAEKINDAIADDLGQAKYTDNRDNFCTISNEPYRQEVLDYTTTEAEELPPDEATSLLKGTVTTVKEYSDVHAGMIIRSAIPGKDGELYFSGSEELLSALGLNTITQSTESISTASVFDAATGKTIVSGVKAEGTEFVSLIPPEIDIIVEPMAALESNWDEATQKFMLTGHKVHTSMLSLKNNGTIFQTGANRGEEFSVQLSSVSCASLGVEKLNVLTRETAARSIGVLDRAIASLSAQRARLGASVNALEHTAGALTVASARLTAAESRLRDADMAKEVMDFTKYSILNQSGTSMLAQANQLPNSVLTLLQSGH